MDRCKAHTRSSGSTHCHIARCIGRAKQHTPRPTVCCRCQPGAGSDSNGNSIVFAVSDGLLHDWPGHPEHAGRVTAAVETLQARGLAAHDRVQRIEYEPAERDTVKLVHAPSLVDKLAQVVADYVRSPPYPICNQSLRSHAPSRYSTAQQSRSALLAEVHAQLGPQRGVLPVRCASHVTRSSIA